MANHANLGKSLETLIEHANKQYRAKGLALVQKVATPWQVIRKGKQIVSAFPEEKSTVDFIGVAGDKAIAFDAKQCHDKTRFPLSNIEPHQMDFLGSWQEQGGTAFFIIEMTVLKKIYRLELADVHMYWLKSLNDGRKSIPVKDFERFLEVKQSGGIVLDYLNLMGRK
ncbi:Holliday junction resolvase RecU [Desulfosporosinus nitroreducens]|uniref:Holliday junction resolvase RecU n=1 Tax=Desulfosporosinus nitroreducens TaxID=2018668 RepID=UPI00207C55BD|nr:Holliday junction resolvase RecU [Desulfosporosinus nitroreducens]MCO1599846.1 Holliday junction resolvase RecU [Desulfosporosinus nitroreducens]